MHSCDQHVLFQNCNCKDKLVTLERTTSKLATDLHTIIILAHIGILMLRVSPPHNLLYIFNIYKTTGGIANGQHI